MKLKPKDIAELTAGIEIRRQTLGLSYADLARGAGVEQSQVHKICHGQFKSMTANVVQICTFLEVAVADSSGGYGGRLAAAVLALWDKTPADGARLLRLLTTLKEIRSGR